MNLYFEKYHSAGNDFIIINKADINSRYIDIISLCDRHKGIGSDGLIIIDQNFSKADFSISFFNPDGSGDTLCGNGSLCAVEYARRHFDFQNGIFYASDGLHSFKTNININNTENIHSISLNNCAIPKFIKTDKLAGYFVDTGSPHFVIISEKELDEININDEAPYYRNLININKKGTNVDFIKPRDDNSIDIRTYEKGVENETLSCGTGSVAAATTAVMVNNIKGPIRINNKGGFHYVNCKKNKLLFSEIKLSGNPQYVFSGKINI